MNKQNMADLEIIESDTPIWLKHTVRVIGLILLAAGLPFTINLFCVAPLMLLDSSTPDMMVYGVVSLTFALLTAGVGGIAFIHAGRALKSKPSKPIRFPFHPLLLMGSFTFLIGLGLIFQMADLGTAIFFPIILVACAILPPTWAVVWMIPRAVEKPAAPDEEKESLSDEKDQKNTKQPPLSVLREQTGISWRRALLAFSGGATASVFIALALEILLPVIVLSLVFNLADLAMENMRTLFRALSNRAVAEALTNRGFLYLFVQFVVIAPIAEEVAKPLVILPLVRNLNKREAFSIGALAGAGFAALENIIYGTGGLAIWAGILIVRALGSALHPLGSGLVALGWRDVLRREKDAGNNWWKRFGIAVIIHAVWNGGSLLVITLGGASFFGGLPPEIDILGLSAGGTTLAFLIILGLATLWIGRAYGYDESVLSSLGSSPDSTRFTPSDRAVAVWAIACLIALVPAGIVGLKLWLR